MTKDKTYRWTSPAEWLVDKAESMDRESLIATISELAFKHDSDTLQDLFQSEMDEDGYFTPEHTI
jgi:hypothetical protein